MTKINDGGPAFPCDSSANNMGLPGMSLRDYFAAKALPAIIRNNNYDSLSADCKAAYQYADAILAEREKGKA